MSDQTVYFFTHIPKTAGTSVRKHLLYPNIPKHGTKHCYGLKDLLRTNWRGCQWLEGHHPYGIHRFMRGLWKQPVYFTMLRDPLERAVSFYYFLRAAKSENYEHPRHSDAIEHDIASFYALPEYRNVQTRFLAGLVWHRLSNWRLGSIWGRFMLRTAKKNLTAGCKCFGLTERHDESLQLFADTFGWSYNIPEGRVKPTRERPSVGELSQRDRDAVREANQLDIALYRFAADRFENQSAYRRASSA